MVRTDPFDLALSRFDQERFDDLPALLEARVARLRAMLAEKEAHTASISGYLSPLEQHVMAHRAERLRGEIAWHEQLLKRLPEFLAAELSRKDAR